MRTRYTLEKELTAKADAENQLQLGLSQLRHVWEAYPELRATENFQQVQNRVSAIESTISDRREQFNDSVNIYNIRTESFPDMLVAGKASFQTIPEPCDEVKTLLDALVITMPDAIPDRGVVVSTRKKLPENRVKH